MHRIRSDGFERVVQTNRSTILLPEDVDALVTLFRERHDRIRLVEDVFNRSAQATEEHPELRVTYLESARDASYPRLLLWREPSGWEPRWSDVHPSARTGLLKGRLGNTPPLRVELEITPRIPVGPGHGLLGQTGAIYRTDDEEARRFVREAWKLLAKVASNVIPRDGQWWGDVAKRYPKEELRKIDVWAGHQALARAEELGVPVLVNFKLSDD